MSYASCRYMTVPLLVVLGAASPPNAAVTSGQILTATVDVTKPPAAPKVQLHLKGGPAYFSFTWIGPSGEAFTQAFRGNPAPSTETFQGLDPIAPESTAPKNVFGLYTEPGTWTLSSLYICSLANCVTYTSSQLAALFDGLTFQVTNPNPPDITPPVIAGAKITTPTVSISGGGKLAIEMGVTDNLSGVSQVEVDASLSQSFSYVSAYFFVDSTVFLRGNLALTGTIQSGSPTGTYTVSRIFLRDVAGNQTYVTDPAELSKLFRGNSTFTVVN